MGRRAANLAIEVRAWSRSKSGGGVAGRRMPASGRRTPTASPTKSRPLTESCRAEVVLGVARRVDGGEHPVGTDASSSPSSSTWTRAASVGVEPPVERVEQVAVDHGRGVDEAAGVDQVAGALLVDVDGGLGEGPGHVAHAAGVVEVDVGDHDVGQVVGGDAEVVQGGEQGGDRRLAPGLDQHRLGARRPGSPAVTRSQPPSSVSISTTPGAMRSAIAPVVADALPPFFGTRATASVGRPPENGGPGSLRW